MKRLLLTLFLGSFVLNSCGNTQQPILADFSVNPQNTVNANANTNGFFKSISLNVMFMMNANDQTDKRIHIHPSINYRKGISSSKFNYATIRTPDNKTIFSGYIKLGKDKNVYMCEYDKPLCSSLGSWVKNGKFEPKKNIDGYYKQENLDFKLDKKFSYDAELKLNPMAHESLWFTTKDKLQTVNSDKLSFVQHIE